MKCVNIYIILLIGVCHAFEKTAWRYSPASGGELASDGWTGLCIEGKKQSPIELISKSAKRLVVEPLQFFNFKTLNGTLTHTGHTTTLRFDDVNCDSGIAGGRLGAMYILYEFHFHWPHSEHIIDGKPFALEMHVVTYNSKYHSFQEAFKLTDHPDAFAVFGVIFEESEKGTEALEPFLERVKNISAEEGLTESFLNFKPLDLFPEDRTRFYRYFGSLTRPPCSEFVTWTLMESKMPVSSKQLEIFKQVFIAGGPGNTSLGFNYRNVLPLNNRNVYLLSDNGAASVSCTLGVIIVCLLNT